MGPLILPHSIAGYNDGLLDAVSGWEKVLRESLASAPLEPSPPKTFKAKMGLPKLPSYSSTVVDEYYWRHWPSNKDKVGKSKIDASRLKEMALETNF